MAVSGYEVCLICCSRVCGSAISSSGCCCRKGRNLGSGSHDELLSELEVSLICCSRGCGRAISTPGCCC